MFSRNASRSVFFVGMFCSYDSEPKDGRVRKKTFHFVHFQELHSFHFATEKATALIALVACHVSSHCSHGANILGGFQSIWNFKSNYISTTKIAAPHWDDTPPWVLLFLFFSSAWFVNLIHYFSLKDLCRKHLFNIINAMYDGLGRINCQFDCISTIAIIIIQQIVAVEK